MKFLRKSLRAIIVFLLSLLSVVYISGCNGSSDLIIDGDEADYILAAVLINDLNLGVNGADTSLIAATLKRNGDTLTSAVLRINNDTLVYGAIGAGADSVYRFETSPRPLMTPAIYGLNLKDSTSFETLLNILVTDTFRISSYVPDSLIPNTNGQEVPMEWTSAAGIQGYVLAAVKQNQAYTGVGYSQYVTSQGTQANLPPDAFRPGGAVNPDTGMYYIYVYGYTGVPDSALSAKLLPVPFPSQLADNINTVRLDGRTGYVVVTKRVPMHVVSQ